MKLLGVLIAFASVLAAQTTPARVRFKIEPEYTRQARKAKLQGLVGLALTVDASGNPTDIRVLRPLGMGLDENAIEAVKHWVFYPAMKDGVPVNYAGSIDVSFKLTRNPPVRVQIER